MFRFAQDHFSSNGRIVWSSHVNVTGVEGAVDSLLIVNLSGQVEHPIFAKRNTDIGGRAEMPSVAFRGNTGPCAGGGFEGILLQHDVDDSADGIRTVLGCSAIAQNFDPLDCSKRNGTEVRAGSPLAGCFQRAREGNAVTPLAVDQHQRVVCTHPAQRRRVKESPVTKGVSFGVE